MELINNKGGQGVLFKVKCKTNGNYFALKKFKHDFQDKYGDRVHREEIFREIDILRGLNRINIAKIIDIVSFNNAPVVVMELCDGSL